VTRCDTKASELSRFDSVIELYKICIVLMDRTTYNFRNNPRTRILVHEFVDRVLNGRDLAGQLLRLSSCYTSSNDRPGDVARTSNSSLGRQEDVWYVLIKVMSFRPSEERKNAPSLRKAEGDEVESPKARYLQSE